VTIQEELIRAPKPPLKKGDEIVQKMKVARAALSR